MPDFLSNNRFRNLFPTYGQFGGNTPPMDPYQNLKFGDSGLLQPEGVTPPTISPNRLPDYDPTARMKELYQPTTDASQQFESMISQYPQREKPGWLRTLAAMLTDYKYGPNAGQKVMDQPFEMKLEDWKNQIAPMQASANLERQENVNSRTLAYQQISAELRDKAQEAKEKNDERNAAIRQQRADIYDFKARNPNMKIVIPKGGNIIAIDPLTGQSHDTGIPTGSLTETDKLNLQQENRMGQIAATGQQTRQTEEVRQTGREAIAETRGWQIFNIPDPNNPGQQKAVKINQITGKVEDITQGQISVPGVTKPSSAGGKPETEASKKLRTYRLAQELYNRNPKLSKFIHLDKRGPGTFDIELPGVSKLRGSYGPTQKEYDEIQDYIYGDMPTVQLGVGVNKPKADPLGIR